MSELIIQIVFTLSGEKWVIQRLIQILVISKWVSYARPGCA